MTRLGPVALVLTVALVPSLAGATITALSVNKCLAGKVKAVAKSAAARANCYSKNTQSPDAPKLAECLGKADDKFDGGTSPSKGAFEKLETKYPPASATPCLTFDDTITTDGTIATYASSVDSDVGTTVGKCDAAKKKCMGKYVQSILVCYGKAATKSGTIDTGCTGKAFTKLIDSATGCLAKAAANGGCTHTGDQANQALRGSADAFVRRTACALDPGNPGCACPTTYAFTANGVDADYDVGWTGINHDGDAVSMSQLTFAISGCTTLSGPIANTGAPNFANHRCRGDTTGANGSWVACTTNLDCPGTGNACVLFFGPPRPDHLGIGELCTLTEVAGATGTIDPDTGSVDTSFLTTLRMYSGLSIDEPCPECLGSTCSGGARNGMPCFGQGTSVSFDDTTSLDCPPAAPSLITTQSATIALTTGTQTRTLTAASPLCRRAGFLTDHCLCDTCNDAAAETCTSDADCPISGGNPGICGGKRCIGGANDGAPCTVVSECPSGACAVPGELTQPNFCSDGVCTPNTPPDNGSSNEGTCAAGPVDNFCAMQPYRGCINSTDCPLAGDTCQSKNRECFTDNGAVGGTVTATGLANFSAPTLAGMFCGAPTSTSAINTIRGLPGLVRYTIPGIATFD